MINSLLEEMYTTECVEDKEGNSVNVFPDATPKIVAEFLYEYVRQYDCQNTLEIGMAFGLSTVAICQAIEHRGAGSHIAIDPYQHGERYQAIGLLNVERAGLAKGLRFIEANSVNALPKLVDEGIRLDLAFIDGNHKFDYVLLDFFYIDMLLETGGLIIFDDLWMPSIRKTVSFVLKNRAYKILHLKAKSNFQRRVERTAARIVQTKFDWESGVKWSQENICILQKQAEDERKWNFFRNF